MITTTTQATNSSMQDYVEEEGYISGLKSPHGIPCPYDGRTKRGKAWWKGFLRGDAERCRVASQPPAIERLTCEVNLETGEYREIPEDPKDTIIRTLRTEVEALASFLEGFEGKVVRRLQPELALRAATARALLARLEVRP